MTPPPGQTDDSTPRRSGEGRIDVDRAAAVPAATVQPQVLAATDAADGSAPASAATRRCDQCGGPVGETMHGRATYAVGGYLLHTGDTEPTIVRKADSDAIAFTYQRLVRPVLLVTCARCYADPSRRARHQRWDFPLV